MRNLITLTIVVGLFSPAHGLATEATKANPWQQTLASVPAAEKPAKAAALVKAASSGDRTSLTVAVVQAALGQNPAAAVSVVGAIAKAVPQMASVAAGAAADNQPGQAVAIARAAVMAAPSTTEEIVAAVCRAAPNEYRNIALSVAEVAPGSSKEILRALASVFPGLKPGIEQALAGSAGATLSVGAILDSMRAVGGAGTAAAIQRSARPLGDSAGSPEGFPRGPTIAPPYVPLPAGVTNVNPSTSGTVPRGDRNYAAP
jgi:hypothetical protein